MFYFIAISWWDAAAIYCLSKSPLQHLPYKSYVQIYSHGVNTVALLIISEKQVVAQPIERDVKYEIFFLRWLITNFTSVSFETD